MKLVIEVTDDKHDDYSWSISCLRRAKKGERFWDFEMDVNVGERLFLTYAVYDTGDSFGTYRGRREFVILNRNEEVARRNVDAIEKHSALYRANALPDDIKFQVQIENDDGERHGMYTPWNGYFESLVRVDIEGLVVMG